MNNIEELRNELLDLMSIKSISQNEVSEALGITQPQVSYFLNKKRGLGGETALKLITFIRERRVADA